MWFSLLYVDLPIWDMKVLKELFAIIIGLKDALLSAIQQKKLSNFVLNIYQGLMQLEFQKQQL